MAKPQRGEERALFGRWSGGNAGSAPRYARPSRGAIGVYTTASSNPEGVTFASRKRRLKDTGRQSSSNPEGVALGLSIGIDYRHAPGRLIRGGDRKLVLLPLWGFPTFLLYLSVGLHPRLLSVTSSGFAGETTFELV